MARKARTDEGHDRINDHGDALLAQQATDARPGPMADLSDALGLIEGKDDPIIVALGPIVAESGALIAEAKRIVVTREDQTEDMEKAGDLRRKLVKVRSATVKAHQTLKAEAWAYGKKIDACKAWVFERVEPVEAMLLAAENFAVNAEAARRAKVRQDRSAELIPLGVDPSHLNLEDMAETTFRQIVENALSAQKAAAAEKARAAEERTRQAQEQAAELDKAKAERDRAEKLAAEMRQQAEAANAAAREAERKLKAEQDERDKKDRAQVAERERAEAQKRRAEEAAKSAPDRVRLLKLASTIEACEIPDMQGAEACEIARRVAEALRQLADKVRQAAEKLGGGA
jgi:hypothetical protein